MIIFKIKHLRFLSGETGTFATQRSKAKSYPASINFRDKQLAPVLLRSVNLNDFMIVNCNKYMAEFYVLERFRDSADEFVVYYFAFRVFLLLRHPTPLSPNNRRSNTQAVIEVIDKAA
jgi:hypothetical protein